MNKKQSLLFISTQLPSKKMPQAGHKIAYSNLEAYSKRYDIYLISSVNEREMKFIERENFKFCKETYFYSVDNYARAFSALVNPAQPLHSAVKVNREAKEEIIKLQKTVKFDVVHFEFTASASYTDCIHQPARKIFVEHDISYQGIRRKMQITNGIKRFLYFLEYHRQKKWELEKLSGVDEIVVLNQKDKDILVRDGITKKKITISYPAVNSSFYNVKRDKVQEDVLLFWGAMNRKENIDAAQWFIDDIFPLILKEVPDCILFAVGANPPKKLLKRQSYNIRVTGFVEDPFPYFEIAKVGIVPLRMGAGIKIKILELLAARVPVVTTSVGAEGIESDMLIVEDNAQTFAQQVIRLLRN